MKPVRFLAVKTALADVLAGSIITSTHAGIPVIDGGNLTQNVMTAIETTAASDAVWCSLDEPSHALWSYVFKSSFAYCCSVGGRSQRSGQMSKLSNRLLDNYPGVIIW